MNDIVTTKKILETMKDCKMDLAEFKAITSGNQVKKADSADEKNNQQTPQEFVMEFKVIRDNPSTVVDIDRNVKVTSLTDLLEPKAAHSS